MSGVPINPVLVAVCCVAALTAHAQVVTSTAVFQGTSVRAIAVQPDGRIVVGGEFRFVDGVPRNNIARLNADGTLDPTWNPDANGPVRALAIDGGGNVYVGGQFTSIGGQSRARIAKLAPTGMGTADVTWNPSSLPSEYELLGDGSVWALALDGNGNLFVGGEFVRIGGESRNGIAKLSTSGTGTADSTWNPGAGFGYVYALAIDGGYVFVGGNFKEIGGQTRVGIAKISASGSVAADPTWDLRLPYGSAIFALAVDGTGNLFAGGQSLALKVSTSRGVVDATWVPFLGGQGSVLTLAPEAVGNLFVGGSMRGYPGPRFLAKVSTSGSGVVDATWDPSPDFEVGALAVTAGGGVCAGGWFATIAGQARPLFACLSSPPGAPTITSIAPGAGQASVAFNPPLSDGGSAVSSYAARCSDGAATQVANGTASPIIVTGLTNNVPYTCTVTATNAAGDGAPSPPGEVTPSTNPGTLPTLNLGTLAFGGQSMGTTSPAREVTFTNSSSLPVTISKVSIAGEFGQSNDCAVLAAAGSCSVRVTFSPAVLGGELNSSIPATGALSVGAAGGTLVVTLAGTAEKSLVTHYYRSILRRDPDAGGKAFWQGEAARVAGLGANLNETWFSLAGTFYASAEYAVQNRNTTEYVRDLYNTFYNRPADDGGLNYWTGQINSGLPREVVLIAFMFSAEFANFTAGIFGSATVRAELNTVIDFYRGILARLPDDGGFNYWVNRFRVAQCQGAAAVTAEVEAISSGFTLSSEYAARARSNGEYGTDLYNGFLRRGGDLGGYQFWVNQIASGARTREQVRVEFKNSPEFQARVNAIIAQGCLQ